MIKLYGFGKSFGLPDASPFVLKVDAYLRMAELAFESVGRLSNIKRAPKGKLPFIEDKDQLIADSQFIFEHLESTYGARLDGWLSTEQKAIAYLISKSLDENLYFGLVYARWQSDESWPQIKAEYFAKFPLLLRLIVPNIARRSVKKSLKGQGMSRHSDTEIKKICDQSFAALNDLIGDKPFVFGAKPCTLDATIYGFLAEFILVSLDTSFNQLARAYPGLVTYCQRIQERYY